MAIEGPLRELGIHDVFQLLDLSRKTGVLRVTSDLRHNEGQVLFEAGAVVSAEIRSNPHPIGTLLVRAGKIDDADLAHARDLQVRGDRRRLGQILVSIGAITERELERQVRRQIEEVIFELLNWREGFFSFAEGPLDELRADVAVRIPTEALLMEAARRIDEWSRIERKIPHQGVIPVLVPEPDSGGGSMLDLLPPEWEVLAAIDGERDIRSIAEFLGRSEFETAKTVFGLESAGVLMLLEGAAPAPSAESAADRMNLVERVELALASGAAETVRAPLESALAADPHHAPLQVLLGRVYLVLGRLTDAEEAFRRALRADASRGDALRLLGATLAQRGRLAEAIDSWERWLGRANGAGEGAEREQVMQAIRAARELETALRVTGRG